jgi:putative PEP-CTERM system TPR-repeat lipoprotein
MIYLTDLDYVEKIVLTMKFSKKNPTLSVIAASFLALGISACSAGDSPESLIISAKNAIEKKDNKTAEIQLKNILQKADNAEARALLGKVYVNTGDFRSAEKELRKAIELGAKRDDLVVPLLQAMYQLGSYQKMIDDAPNLSVTDSTAKAIIASLIAKAQIGLTRTEAAKKTLEEALLESPGNSQLQATLISLRMGQGNDAALKLELDKLIEKEPNSTEAYIQKGDIELAAGDLPAAKAIYIKVAQLAPSDPLVRAKLAAIFIDSADYKQADEQIAELQKVSPNSAGTWYLKALLAYRQNKLEEARDHSLASLKGAPDYLPSIILAGNVYLALGSHESAERYARMIIERAPETLQGHRLLGATYLKMNAPERALLAIKPILDKGVQDSTLFSIAGEASLKLNDAAKASLYFEKATKIDPKDASKRTGLALSRMASGDRDKAFSELEEAVLIDTKNYQADFALIMARVRDKQFDKALEAVDRLEGKMPKSPIPHNLRGLISLAQNNESKAIISFEKALSIDPTFFASVANLATLETKAGKPQDAKKRYETLLKADPKNIQTLVALATHVQRNGGTTKEAAEYLKLAKVANPGAIPPIMALANFYLENNEPKEAIPILQEALNGANSERQDLLDLLGTSFLRINDRAQAIETYERLLQINPKSSSTHYRLGEMKLQGRDETGALQSFKRASELAPQAPEPKIAIATILVRQGKIAEAKQIAANLKKELPQSAIGLGLEGDLATIDKQPLEAAAAYRKALAVEKQPMIVVKLHKALLAANKPAEAQASLTEWFKATPDDLTLRLYSGEYELTQQKWQVALDHYNYVLKQDPKHAIALNNSAWAYSKLGDLPKAVALAEQAYSSAQNAPPIIDTLGTILIQAGNQARGLELLRQAVSMAPKQSDYRLHLAEALFKGGDLQAAKKEVEMILKDAPTGQVLEATKALSSKL